MSTDLENRLRSLGISLPPAAPPSALYSSFIIENRLLYISGQLPLLNGEVQFKGKIGEDISLEDAQKAAYVCGLNILAQVRLACEESFERIKRCVRLGGFLNTTPSFSDHSKVMNAASDLIIQVFGNLGRHTRSSIGVTSLPLNAALEIEAVFALEDEEVTPFS